LCLLLREVFPASPLLLWPELWLRPEHMGIAPGQASLEQLHYLRTKNWLLDGALGEGTGSEAVGDGLVVSVTEAFEDVDALLYRELGNGLDLSGATATVALHKDGKLLVAGLGDTRAILGGPERSIPIQVASARGSNL